MWINRMKLFKTETAVTIFFTAIVTSIATIIVSPISISLAFWLNDYFARPILSVEYIQVFHEYEKLQNPKFDIKKILFSDSFQMNLLRGSSESLDKFMKYGNNEFLSESEINDLKMLSEDVKISSKKKLDTLKIYYNRILNNDFNPDTYAEYSKKIKNKSFTAKTNEINFEDLKARTKIDIEKEMENESDLLRLINNLLNKLNFESSKNINDLKFKLSIQNKGNTDGLIKSIGEMSILGEDISFPIINIPPPKKKSNVMAIAVTIADEEPEAPTSQSVGKIEKHSLKEFWFGIEKNNNSKEGLQNLNVFIKKNKPIWINIDLADHNNSKIKSKVHWKPFDS